MQQKPGCNTRTYPILFIDFSFNLLQKINVYVISVVHGSQLHFIPVLNKTVYFRKS